VTQPTTKPSRNVLPMPAMDDRVLWERLSGGDAHAQAAFYDRFQGDVNRLVRRLLGVDTEHDDLVQQIFLKLFESAHRLRNAATLAHWVRTVAVNTVHSELRKRRVRRFWSPVHREPDSYAGVATSPEASQLLRRIYDVLHGLPADEHVTFVLHYIDERSLSEVAELNGCSTATVKRRLIRARERIAKVTAGDEDLKRILGERT
jgi:RNA polymerase sigma-70 factor, ECF subfamily